MLRPFAWIGGAAATALIVAPFCPDQVIWILMAASFVLAIGAVCLRRLRNSPTIWTVLFCFGAALFFYQVHEHITFEPQRQAIGTTVSIRAQVCDLPTHFDNSVRYDVRVLDGDLPADTVVWYYDSFRQKRLSPGDVVSGRFTVEPTYDTDDTMAYLYLKSTGVLLYLQPVGDVAVSSADGFSLTTALLNGRLAIRDGLNTYFTEPVAGTLGAICFGDRDLLSDTLTDEYRRTGLSHLLAVSGLHLTVVTGAIYALFRRRFKRRVTAGLSIGFVWLFMALTGFSASVVRAGIMTILVLIGHLLFREPDGFNSVGLAVLVIVLFRPAAMWDIGLQLSVCATIGLLEWHPRLQAAWHDWLFDRIDPQKPCWYRSLIQAAGDSVCVTLSATLPTLVPIMIYYGELSLITPLANLLVVPLTTALVCMGLITGLVCGIGLMPDIVVDLVGLPTGLIVRLQHGLVSCLSEIPFTQWHIDGIYPIVWVCGTLLVWGITRHRLIKTRLLSVACIGCLCAGMLTAHLTTPSVRRMALSVGSDVAICVTYQDYTGVVVSLHQEDTAYQLKEALDRQGMHRLDFLLLTDADGVGIRQLYALLDDVSTELVLVPPDGDYLPELITTLPVDQLKTTPGDTLTIGQLGTITRLDGFIGVMWQGASILLGYDETALAQNLPPVWRWPDTVIYSGKPPSDATCIVADQIIVNSYWNDPTQSVRTTAYGQDCILA